MPKKQLQPRTEDRTVHLHKIVFKKQFKKRAPHAIKSIKAIATKCMGTTDVRVDQKLNKHIWSNGVRNLPRRVRVRFSRKRNEDEDAKEKMYTLVQYVPVEPRGFKGLQTEAVVEESQAFRMCCVVRGTSRVLQRRNLDYYYRKLGWRPVVTLKNSSYQNIIEMSTQLPDIANGSGQVGQPESGANMMPSSSGLAGQQNEIPRQRSAFDSQRGSNQLQDAKSVFQSRRERQEVERDAQLLANRIALLKQEEMKTWKKIEETKKKAAEVMRLKQKNEERIRSKVEKMQYDNMRAQDTKDRINRMKEEHRFEKERIGKMTVLTKKEEARQARIRAEQDKIRFQTQQAYIQKLNQDRKSRVQEDQRLAGRKMEEQKIQKIRQQRLQVERQIRDEEEQITHKEQEVMQMELLELELIKKLQNTQAIQTQAYEELKQAIEQKGSGGFGYRSAGQSQFQGGLPMDQDQQQMEASGEGVNNPPEVDPQPMQQEVNQ